MRTSSVLYPIAIGLVGLVGACTSGPDYPPTVIVTPRVEYISLDFARVSEHNHLFAELWYHVDEPPLGPNELTRARFETSNGDHEDVLGPAEQFLVTLKPGFTFEDVKDRIASVGQVTAVLQGGTTFSVQVLRFDIDRREAHRILASWREVDEIRYEKRGDVSFPGMRPPYNSFVDIQTTPGGQPGDFKLRIAPGDTVWVTYENKVGPPVTGWGVVPD